MDEILYLDLYFFTNFFMDLVSLAVTSFAVSEKIGFFRMVLFSVFGAVFSCALTLFQTGPFFSFFLSLLVLPPLLFFAFGKRRGKRFFRIGLFYFVASLFLGGAAEALSYYMGRNKSLTFGVFLGITFLALGIFQLFCRNLNKKLETAVVSLAIRFSGRSECFFGLVDSGLLLRDPEKGMPVLILKAEYALPLLTSEELERVREGGEGTVPIPMKTASGTGVLYAFRPDGVRILRKGQKKERKEKRDVLVALDFTSGGFGGCPCLVPLSVL